MSAADCKAARRKARRRKKAKVPIREAFTAKGDKAKK